MWGVQIQHQQRQRRMQGSRILAPYGQRVYSYLFTSYMNYYLGQGKVYDEWKLGVGLIVIMPPLYTADNNLGGSADSWNCLYVS